MNIVYVMFADMSSGILYALRTKFKWSFLYDNKNNKNKKLHGVCDCVFSSL